MFSGLRFSCFGAVPSYEGSAMPSATLVAFVAMKSFSRGTWLSRIARPDQVGRWGIEEIHLDIII